MQIEILLCLALQKFATKKKKLHSSMHIYKIYKEGICF